MLGVAFLSDHRLEGAFFWTVSGGRPRVNLDAGSRLSELNRTLEGNLSAIHYITRFFVEAVWGGHVVPSAE